MNIQCKPYKEPIKIFIVNPLTPASKLVMVKIMSGYVFGTDQLIDLTLLVTDKDTDAAKTFKMELLSCAFSCTNSISILSEIPSVLDGDVFCFITNFYNPIDFNDDLSKTQLDATLRLIINIARSLSCEKKENNPIVMADSLAAIDILNTFSRTIASDVFFCSTILTTTAKCVLAKSLKLSCSSINDVFVWGADDEIFHIEVEKPIIIDDETQNKAHCTWDVVGPKILKKLNYDSTHFNATWMRKEFIQKVASSALKNPQGCVYRAAEFAQTLKDVWIMRTREDSGNVWRNIGVISDGSIGTIKGYPYVLPIMFSGNSWNVSDRFEDDIHLKQEIKRINKASRLHHEKLMAYCKKNFENMLHSKTTESQSTRSFWTKKL